MAFAGEALAAQDDALIRLFDGSVAVGFDLLCDSLSRANGETNIDLTRMAGSGARLRNDPETRSGLEPPAGAPPYVNPF
jgi:hypothetical protein